MLRAFFRPLNERLASLLDDEKFLWKDVETGGGGVSSEDVARHKLDDRAQRGKPKPPPPQQQSLVALVAAGDAHGVAEYLKDGAVTNVGDVLSVAALTLDEPVLKVLLDHGLDANATEGLGKGPGASPLHVACQTMTWGDSMKHSFVFALLANTGHPLDKAIERGSSSLGHRVLQHKGDTTYGQLHIRQALGGAALRVVRLLLAHGGDPNALDSLGRTPAHYCAAAGFGDALIALSEGGADLDIRDAPHMSTPLHVAALHGQGRSVVALLERGADPKIKDGHGHDLSLIHI